MEVVRYNCQKISPVAFEELICRGTTKYQKEAIKEIFDLCLKEDTTIFIYTAVPKRRGDEYFHLRNRYFQIRNTEARMEQIENMTSEYTEDMTYEVVKTVSFRIFHDPDEVVRFEFLNKDEGLKHYFGDPSNFVLLPLKSLFVEKDGSML